MKSKVSIDAILFFKQLNILILILNLNVLCLKDLKARNNSAKAQVEEMLKSQQDISKENQKLLERLDREMANGEELYNELECLKVQFEAEKAEIRISHELALNEKSDEIEGIKRYYTIFLTTKYSNISFFSKTSKRLQRRNG